jgi:hypothetical protein
VFTSPTRAREFEGLLVREGGEVLDVAAAREVGQKTTYKESRWEHLALPGGLATEIDGESSTLARVHH